ncbi:uncharacterized protein LOC143459899 [Clavelina lepadiformis]|uniref:Uncharacterized protein n=1 Tax=Clavelina lepadiformis TaxID=159417 RepID=A0ABP0FB34_CLALP
MLFKMLVLFLGIYPFVLQSFVTALPTPQNQQKLQEASVGSSNILSSAWNEMIMLQKRPEFLGIIPDDVEIRTPSAKTKVHNSKCTDIGETCSTSAECCSYPSVVCVVYVSGSSWGTFCSPRWMVNLLEHKGDLMEDSDKRTGF